LKPILETLKVASVTLLVLPSESLIEIRFKCISISPRLLHTSLDDGYRGFPIVLLLDIAVAVEVLSQLK